MPTYHCPRCGDTFPSERNYLEECPYCGFSFPDGHSAQAQKERDASEGLNGNQVYCESCGQKFYGASNDDGTCPLCSRPLLASSAPEIQEPALTPSRKSRESESGILSEVDLELFNQWRRETKTAKVQTLFLVGMIAMACFAGMAVFPWLTLVPGGAGLGLLLGRLYSTPLATVARLNLTRKERRLFKRTVRAVSPTIVHRLGFSRSATWVGFGVIIAGLRLIGFLGEHVGYDNMRGVWRTSGQLNGFVLAIALGGVVLSGCLAFYLLFVAGRRTTRCLLCKTETAGEHNTCPKCEGAD